MQVFAVVSFKHQHYCINTMCVAFASAYVAHALPNHYLLKLVVRARLLLRACTYYICKQPVVLGFE